MMKEINEQLLENNLGTKEITGPLFKVSQLICMKHRLDLRTVVIETEEGFEGQDTAPQTKKSTLDLIVPNQVHRNPGQEIHQELECIVLIGHKGAAASTAWP